MRKAAATTFALAGFFCGAAMAADAPRHIDLARYYFPTPAAEKADRQTLQTQIDKLAGLRKDVAKKPAVLLRALLLNDDVQRSYGRHDAYLLLECRSDRKAGTACGDLTRLSAAVDGATDGLKSAVAEIPPATAAAFLKTTPQLAPYRYWIAQARDEPRRALADFEPEISGWQDELYEQALSKADFGTIATPQGPLDVRRQRNLIAVHPDPAVRRAGVEKRYAAYASIRDDVAFALIHTAKAGNHLALAGGFANAPDRKYRELGLDPRDVRATIESVASHGELNKRFERLRAGEVGRPGAEQGPWDNDVPLATIPNLELENATAVIHEAFAPLGAWYQGAFDRLVDPVEGRFDVVRGGAQNRSTGGFSVGYAGAQSALFIGMYDGTFKDLSVIVHEGGHAVHRGMMNAHHVLPVYTTGPRFLFESFAEFNELVLADAMSSKAKSAAERRYYDEQFLSIKGLDFLAGAQDAALEQAVYDGVASSGITSADDLDALTLKIDGRFSAWPERYAFLKARWEAMSLAYEDPLYNVNYMYASMLALKYFELYKSKPDWFLPRYRALLENGFDDTPEHLLNRFLDIKLHGPSLLEDAVSEVERRLRDLELSSVAGAGRG